MKNTALIQGIFAEDLARALSDFIDSFRAALKFKKKNLCISSSVKVGNKLYRYTIERIK